ncbi:MAG: 3-dehydroquinate synthase [Alphaproteobacteria bacterium]|nr:3-dehydroquinate synthase [Alphaproteobacteria bacterium]
MSATAIECVRVGLGERGYEVMVGPGLIAAAGELIAPVLRQRRVIVVTDRNVATHHLDGLLRALGDAGIAHDHIILPPGEQTKDFAHLQQLLTELLARKPERRTALMALGGGVIGDLTGLAASLLLRGVDFIQVPTTLLAQVDSSVGGKTGIDTAEGKNLIGAFYQPRLVLCDTGALDTLPRRDRLAGYAEAVKYGLIGDAAFFAWCEGHGARVIEGDAAARRHAVVTSVRAKAAIVAEDEREEGRRALLNLGHTFGHALEAETGFGGELLHGEAVAVGMVMAFDLSARLGLCALDHAARLRRHLAAIGLPADLADLERRTWDPDRLIDHMGRDKKVRDGRIAFVLARAIGDAFLAHDVATAEVRAMLAEAAAA